MHAEIEQLYVQARLSDMDMQSIGTWTINLKKAITILIILFKVQLYKLVSCLARFRTNSMKYGEVS